MALPPTLPTSFVPKQPVASQAKHSRPAGIFYYIAIFAMGVAVVGSAGTFGYSTYLTTVEQSRKLKLEAAEKGIDPVAVEDFIRLRNRIQAASGVLDRHIVTSQFFDLLETLTLQNVRFQSLLLTIADDRVAIIEMRGLARSFNALAAQSAEFANEKRIKRAIFSGITADKSGFVQFALQAELVPKLTTAATAVKMVSETPNIATTTPFAPEPPPVVATTTPTAATTTKVAPKTP